MSANYDMRFKRELFLLNKTNNEDVPANKSRNTRSHVTIANRSYFLQHGRHWLKSCET